jgi:hypothetical protein
MSRRFPLNNNSNKTADPGQKETIQFRHSASELKAIKSNHRWKHLFVRRRYNIYEAVRLREQSGVHHKREWECSG